MVYWGQRGKLRMGHNGCCSVRRAGGRDGYCEGGAWRVAYISGVTTYRTMQHFVLYPVGMMKP
jgi:hypothetical protein